MQYYQLTGITTTDIFSEENDNPRKIRQQVLKINTNTKNFNGALSDKAFFFLEEISNDYASIGILSKNSKKILDLALEYLNKIQIELSDVNLEEITFEDFSSMLYPASRSDFIDSPDDILEKFDLNMLKNRHFSDLRYAEYLIEKSDKAYVYNAMKGQAVSDEYKKELDRIYAGRKLKNGEGHPVHYIIQTDDRGLQEKMTQTLLKALFANQRIRNKRVTMLCLTPDCDIDMRIIDCLFKSNIGGTIVIKNQVQNVDESDTANTVRDIIERICRVVKKYSNQVLTLICMPRECSKLKELYFENLGNISFIELEEKLLSNEGALNYLKDLAKEKGLRTDKKLISQIEAEKVYSIAEMSEMFGEWSVNKIKQSVYPQYKDIVGVKHEIQKAQPKGSSYDELCKMIGLDKAKKVIKQALDFNKAQKLFAEKGMNRGTFSRHMIFTGNPGTAKTSVARLFAGIMKENGILSTGKLVEVGRGDLVGRFVGWTAPIVKKKFQEARGGVLFIDEAYSLVDDKDGLYGDEAINTIVQEMENHRDDVVVIFAGYPDKMEKFLAKNPGLRSRIAYHVQFDDYDTESLLKIAKLIASQKGVNFTDEACEKLNAIFEDARQEGDFGNGRYVRNIVEKALVAQASRLVAENYDSVSKNDIATICADDIEMPKKVQKKETIHIGFCA